ncbi:MAG: hypothetical protein M3448_09435 [Pseudomonadota bacterium]|nr:hypothetical protein [Pseudomonadota bacterium]
MRLAILLSLLVAGCGTAQPPSSPDATSGNSSSGGGQAGPWDLQTGGAGATLVITGASGGAAIRLSCPAGEPKLVVNVPAFDPIGSEERLSFGQGGEVVALVADSRGDRERGGVTGEGAVPDGLATLLSGPVSASYGAQLSGPHPVPPANLVNAFAAACSGGTASTPPGQSDSAAAASGSPCLTGRDGKPVPANAIKAIGTEPFWGAKVQGRCVTYSHPEDQSGTRIWTEFSGTAESGTWSGFLNERPFVMRTRRQQGCSDGMSDNRYPIAVTLTVHGEQRTGCAEPA